VAKKFFKGMMKKEDMGEGKKNYECGIKGE
jgi:hypothetical protein